ncbi:MAG: FHA domain-containing protein [Elusimicrobiota bacterium]
MSFYISLKDSSNIIAEYLISKNEIFVGRDNSNDIIINDNTVSSKHFKIIGNSHNFEIEDMNSTNGTFVMDKKIKKISVEKKCEIKVCGYIINVKFLDINIKKAEINAVLNPYDERTKFELNRITTFIGNPQRSHIPAKSKNQFSTISDYAAAISIRENKYFLIPINPENVILNASPITKPVELKNNDEIEVGITKFVFKIKS